MAAAQRVELHYSGQVQGVGFRQTTALLARNFEVSGFVQNLTDGRVRLVVEGEPGELQRFLDTIDEELGSFIRQREIERQQATGQFGQFTVRY